MKVHSVDSRLRRDTKWYTTPANFEAVTPRAWECPTELGSRRRILGARGKFSKLSGPAPSPGEKATHFHLSDSEKIFGKAKRGHRFLK